MQSGSIHGFPAASANFAATTEQGTLRGVVAFVSYGGLLYRLLGYTPEAQWGTYRRTFQAFIGSFDRLTDRAALNVQPLRLEIVRLDRAMTLEEFARRYPSQALRLEIVRLDRAMTLEEFARRYPSQVELDALALLNQVEPRERLAAGARVKRVVGGPLP